VPLHTPTIRIPPIARTAAVASACIAATAATAAIADDQPVPQVRTVTESVATRYFDIEANKAASMRALGLHIAEQRADPTSRYQDLEANKARSQAASEGTAPNCPKPRCWWFRDPRVVKGARGEPIR
jgi:hypothetical protein